LILSLTDHFQHLEWIKEKEKTDPGFLDLISYSVTYDSLFLFVLIIGFYEMTTKPSWIKIVLRIFLVCVILGTQFSGLIPIEDFYFGVYNTAWFSTFVAVFHILVRIELKQLKK